MTLDAWLSAAISDAERRGLPALRPLLEALARATRSLRNADFNDDAAGRTGRATAGARPADSSPGRRSTASDRPTDTDRR